MEATNADQRSCDERTSPDSLVQILLTITAVRTMSDHIIIRHAWIPPIPRSNDGEEIVRVAVHQLLEEGSANLDIDFGV
jgi:hypothetical protein